MLLLLLLLRVWELLERAMSNRKTLLAIGAAILVAGAGPARADTDPATTIKPLVLFLLDTSGSMEYEAGDLTSAANEFTVPLCEEPSATSPSLFAPGDFPKSRLIVAKEVLTGTMRDFWCQYDYRDANPSAEDYLYPIPHVTPCSGDTGAGCPEVAQDFDGVLDIFRDQMKFGIMTFDSLDGDGANATGMWSYGPEAPGTSGLNLGIRNARWGSPDSPNVWDEATQTWTYADPDRGTNNRGQLIAPSLSDDFAPVRQANRWAQYEINSTIGYWGTPLAPMLTDARYFLLTDPSVKPFDAATGEGDPYSNCRERTVVLITDGRASQGEGVHGYPTTLQAVADLKNTPPTPVRVFVVGFNLQDSDTSLIEALDPDLGGPADEVFIADTPQDLQQALSAVLSAVQSDIQSRTGITYTNATRSTIDLQYQFQAAFQADQDNPTNLVGYLDQVVYQCSEDCVGVSDSGGSCPRAIVRIHERLNARANSTRDLMVALRGQIQTFDDSLLTLAASGSEMEALFGVPQNGNLPKVEPDYFVGDTPINSGASLGPASDLNVQREYMTQLIALVRADDGSARQLKHMGGITHATPVVQEPALEGQYPIRSWDEYVKRTMTGATYSFAPKCRPTMLYTGSHDGFIHAFRVDHKAAAGGACATLPNQSDDDVGKEIWALLPEHLLRRTHTLVNKYNFLMDGQLALRDVLMRRGDPLTTDPAVEALDWKSVLLAGYGAGGRGYIALDVTHALEGPQVMWELSPEGRAHAGTLHAPSGTDPALDANDFTKLGLTKPRPVFGTAFIGGEETAIAVLAGGDSPDDASAPEAGRALYVVRLDTGEKLREFSNEAANIYDADGVSSASLTHPLTGTPAVYADTPGVVSTRIFAGDAGGRMWRVDIADDDPANWTMALFYDPYATGAAIPVTDPLDRQPVFGSPAVALENAFGELAVVFGTGDVDYVSQSTDALSGVFSVSERIASDQTVTPYVNWAKVFTANERLTGEPLVFAEVAYFTSYESNATDACDLGTGRLYGLHFVDDDPDDPGLPVGALDEDGVPPSDDLVESVTLSSAVPFGVQIIERPACIPDQTNPPAPGLGPNVSSSGIVKGDLELVVNVAKGSGFSPKTVPPGVVPQDLTTRSVVRGLVATGEMLQSSAWGQVLY